MDPKSVWTVVPMYALRSWKMFPSLGLCFSFLTAFPLTYLYASHSLNTPVGTSFLVLKFCLISVIGWIVYWLFLLSGKTFVGCPWIVGSFTWCAFKNNSCFRLIGWHVWASHRSFQTISVTLETSFLTITPLVVYFAVFKGFKDALLIKWTLISM